MIIVRIFGGLGNQMFQYAFYKAIKEVNDDVYIDISDYQIHKHHNGFELDNIFNVNFDIASNKQISELSLNKNRYIYRLINKIFKVDMIKKYEYIEMNDISRVNIDNINKNVYFNGFWQDKIYVEYVAEILKREFNFKHKLDGKNKDLVDDIKNNNSVSVHIRRGDYIDNSTLGGICNKEYYLKAMEVIKQKTHDPMFIFFSDDMEWVKSNLKTNNRCIYVDWNKGKDSYKDMQLMSYCNHNIIANSTFSWWGAWLNNNNNNIVICPKKWYTTSNNNKLINNNWIGI